MYVSMHVCIWTHTEFLLSVKQEIKKMKHQHPHVENLARIILVLAFPEDPYILPAWSGAQKSHRVGDRCPE